MFTDKINVLTLTSAAANTFFSNITVCGNAFDSTFIATLRMLLYKRLPKDEDILLSYSTFGSFSRRLTADNYMELTVERIAKDIRRKTSAINIIYSNDSCVGKQLLEIANGHAGFGKPYMRTYEKREDLQLFYAKMLNGLFYIDADNKNTVIFLDGLSQAKQHALQMMIPKYLPWLFAENPLSEKEKLLLKSLGLKHKAEYEQLITELVEESDICSELVRIQLKDFEMEFGRSQIDETKRSIKLIEKELTQQINSISNLRQKLMERQIYLAGLVCKTNELSDGSELLDYFLCNKNLHLVRTYNEEIEFVIHGYLDIYDDEAFELYVANSNSYLYGNISKLVTQKQMELLYRAIFGDGEYKLRTCAAYALNIKTGMSPLENYNFPLESHTYLPNPHIQNYACVGGFAPRFGECMRYHNYVGAIDQAVISTRNLNFHDSTVIERFVSTLSNTSIVCIETADGTLLTPKAAIKRLEKRG